jgi:hypothetical protein
LHLSTSRTRDLGDDTSTCIIGSVPGRDRHGVNAFRLRQPWLRTR